MSNKYDDTITDCQSFCRCHLGLKQTKFARQFLTTVMIKPCGFLLAQLAELIV